MKQELLQAVHQYCEQSGGQPGEDMTTHHLIQNSKGEMVCRYCKQTQRKIEGQ